MIRAGGRRKKAADVSKALSLVIMTEVEHRALAGLAVDRDRAVMVVHDAMHHRQAQLVPSPGGFVVKDGSTIRRRVAWSSG